MNVRGNATRKLKRPMTHHFQGAVFVDVLRSRVLGPTAPPEDDDAIELLSDQPSLTIEPPQTVQ